jgi:peptidoglycan hydrolase-like protein with peptidoglycan-binding domain
MARTINVSGVDFDAFLMWDKAAPAAQEPEPMPAPSSGAAVDIHALVVMLQQALNAQGYDAGPVDGDPGQRTQAALTRWQNRTS